MRITVELPDDLSQYPDPSRMALEALAIEGYRCGALTHNQAGQLLGMSRFQFADFLTAHNIEEHAYSAEDLEQDMIDLELGHERGTLGR
jgi:predicted HTH domain antitoxin